MPTKRTTPARLNRDKLLGVLDAYELDVPNQRVKDRLIDDLAFSRKSHISEI